MYKFLLILFSGFSLVSCDKTRSHKANGTYIGGIIENPRSNYVILSFNETFLDSVALDKNNRFLYRNDTLKEGVYTFKHREYQRFYIYPKDSLLFHVNTIDFDESLKYSGIGAQKNNLLMQLFLEDEKVQAKISDWFDLEPQKYLDKVDSVAVARKKLYQKYISKQYFSSKAFKNTVKVNLNYDGYLWRELYVSANLLEGNQNIKEELPKGFLKHRKEIDFGNDLKRSHYSYYRFMDNYFNNVAYDSYKNLDSFDRGNFEHTRAKMKAVKSLTHNEALRNKLLRGAATDYLLHSTNANKAEQLFDLFKKCSTKEEDISEILHILDQTIKLIPGNEIPNVQIVGLDNQTRTLQSIIKKPTVIYFWTYESTKHYREVHEKAKDLREKYPEYNFIAINADDHFRKWKRIAETISTDKHTEYQLDNLPSAKLVLILDLPERTIIVDGQGKIINANAAITDMAFEDVL